MALRYDSNKKGEIIIAKQKKNLELLYKRIRETESETRRRSLKHQEAIEETLMLLSDLTKIVFDMVEETKEPELSAKEQFIKEIWQKRQELRRCKPEQRQFIQDELNEMKQEYLDYLEFQTEAKGR